ncbi:MAG: hypothetical protein NC311_05560 [Muribaculaceae bacterium]|nr:hypothetical protein [Muribaculaceae bacterium]
MVAGWTKLLTDTGEVEIRDVVDQTVKVWNGQVFSEVEIHGSQETHPTVIMTFDNGATLFCNPGHIFKLGSGDRDCARNITPGTVLGSWNMPDGTIRSATLKEITTGPDLELFGFTEPFQHSAVFNGIHTWVTEGIDKT